MDIIGSLVDTRLRIYPMKVLIKFLEDLPKDDDIPNNILKCIGRDGKGKKTEDTSKPNKLIDDEDIKVIRKINTIVNGKTNLCETYYKVNCNPHFVKEELGDTLDNGPDTISNVKDLIDAKNTKERNFISAYEQKHSFYHTYEKEHFRTPKGAGEQSAENKNDKDIKEEKASPFLTIPDIEWLSSYLQKRRSWGDDVPYLHGLLEKAFVEMPQNQITKRLPDDLAARCVELRARRDREFNTMTLNITVESVKVDYINERTFNRKSLQPGGIPKFAAMLRQIHLLPSKNLKEKEHQD